MDNERTITIRRLRTGSVFRIVAAGICCTVVPFFVLMGIFALFGSDTLVFNEQPITGWPALLLSPFMALIAAGVLTLFCGSGLALGLWIYSKIRPMAIRVIVDDETNFPSSRSSA
jgi:TRAP-type C4-dicarboxylate transport system permease small subunit